ncbi:MAG: MFS transporter [Patescibacteria group bacterium]
MKEIRKIYVVHFLAGLSTASSVTFTLYFLSHGIDQFQIAQLFGFFMLALALLEIPTGGVADTFGHKTSVTVGLFFQSVSFLLFFLFPSYWGILSGMLMSALGLALQSGATSSLIYELLKKEHIHQEFKKIYGRANGYFLIAGFVAAPLGSLVYASYPKVPYFFSFFVLLLSAIVLYTVKWDFIRKSVNFESYKNTLISGVMLTLKHKLLIAIVIIGIALTVNRLVFNQNISQPYLVGIGVDVAYIGFIAAGISAILAFISIYSYKIAEKIGTNASLLLIIILPSIAVFILGLINNMLALAIILFLVVGHAFRDPVVTHIVHEELDSEKRGTMASTMSFLTGIVGSVMLPFFGAGIDTFGMHTTLFLLGIFTFVIGGIGFIVFTYKKA